MENITGLNSIWRYDPKMAFSTTRWGVVTNIKLESGILLSTSLLGLLTYIAVFVWAFWNQRRGLNLFTRSFIMSFSCQHINLRGVQNIHVSLIALIFIDVVNAIAAIIYGSQLAGSACSSGVVTTCHYTSALWFNSRLFIVQINLLTSFISLLYLCYPKMGAKLRCVFSVVSLLICVFYYAIVLYGSVYPQYMLEALTCGLALAIIAQSIVSAFSPSAARGRQKEKILIVSLAMCNFLIVYFPSFVLRYLKITDQLTIVANVFYFTNFQVFIDGLLCSLILKMSAGEEVDDAEKEEQEQQKQQQQQLELKQQWPQPQPQQQLQQQQQPQQQWQQQQPQRHWQQQQPEDWEQQQQQQHRGFDFPRAHANARAIAAYDRENWN